MNRIQSQWLSPPLNAPRQVLGAVTNVAIDDFFFSVPAHVLGILTLVVEGEILIVTKARAGSEWQKVPEQHALGGFTASTPMMAKGGTRWVSLFTRADSWALLSGRSASHFTDRFFDRQSLADSASKDQGSLGLLDLTYGPKSELQVIAHDLHQRACQDLNRAARRQGTTLVNKALEALEQLDLPEAIQALGINERRLQRAFKSELGLSAKFVQRMARLHRTVNCWNAPGRKEKSIADLAFKMGFADQAHLAREFRLLAGLGTRQLKLPEASDENLMWALQEGGRFLAPGIFGKAPVSPN
jgi:AraC-like DNA-binding protein